MNYWTESLNSVYPADIIYFDFKKARSLTAGTKILWNRWQFVILDKQLFDCMGDCSGSPLIVYIQSGQVLLVGSLKAQFWGQCCFIVCERYLIYCKQPSVTFC